MKTALLLVDLQNDFMPWGRLPVAGGDEVVPVANSLLASGAFDLAVASQDWHPRGHGSFASSHLGRKPGEQVDLGGIRQVLWPDHCVVDSPGASFHAALDVAAIDRVFRKGTDPGVDSYSAFFDNARRKATGLGPWLKERGVGELWMLGLATDYCVQFSALDALELGLEVRLVLDGCRGVELAPGDCERALAKLRAGGARIVSSAEIPAGARR